MNKLPVLCKCFARMRKVGMDHDDVIYWCSTCGSLRIGKKFLHPKGHKV